MTKEILVALVGAILTVLAGAITIWIKRRIQPEESSKMQAETKKTNAERERIERTTEVEVAETATAFALALQKGLTDVQQQLVDCRRREIEMMEKISEIQMQSRLEREVILQKMEAIEGEIKQIKGE